MSAASTVGSCEIVWLQHRLSPPGFTARDQSELARWGSEDSRAVVLEDEPTAFAMLYEGSMPWASWAVTRQDGAVVVWNCVTFADIGHFGCMVDALAALSGADSSEIEALPNVVSFTAARLEHFPNQLVRE